MIPVLDVHCDALQRALDLGHLLEEETHGHFDFVKGRRGGLAAAVLTAWVDGSYAREPGSSKRRANALLDAADDLFARAPGAARRVLDPSELDALPEGVTGVFLAIEGGHAIEDDLAQLEHFAARGVRLMTLTWNNHLSWARSCQDGAEAGVPAGLSGFGREVVRRMEELDIVVDLSHAGERTFYDVLECATRPPLVSHSGCQALADHPRNATDAQLRALAARGGVIGIPFVTPFLDEAERAAEQAVRDTDAYRQLGEGRSATERSLLRGDLLHGEMAPFPIEHVVRHVLHALEIAGPEHVCIGADFDGIERRPAGLADASGYAALWDALGAAGVDETVLRGVAFGNARRILTRAGVTSHG